MTESEIMDQRKMPAVPFELQFQVQNRDVLDLWAVWNEKKRGKMPVVPGVANENLQNGVTNEEMENVFSPTESTGNLEREVNGSGKGKTNGSASSRKEAAVNDAHVWSHGGHD